MECTPAIEVKKRGNMLKKVKWKTITVGIDTSSIGFNLLLNRTPYLTVVEITIGICYLYVEWRRP